MTVVEILIVLSIVLLVVATVTALLLVNRTKFMALWICCIISLVLLGAERVLQLYQIDGGNVPPLAFAWVGIVVSVSFSICVVCARFLVNHVDRVTHQRRELEKRLMTAVLRTEERQRDVFSRELHDGIGPLLSSAKMSLSALGRAELTEKERMTLRNTSQVIDEAIRSLREISNNLSPHVLNNFGLARGIKNFVDRLSAMHEVKIEFSTDLRDERFDSNIEVILYRVVCELINNSLKHSHCTTINLSLRHANGCLIVEYGDNGCGFTPQSVEQCGMGLSNIRSRVSSLGGKIIINSRPNAGMTARIAVATDGSIEHVAADIYEQISNNKRERRGRNGRRKG